MRPTLKALTLSALASLAACGGAGQTAPGTQTKNDAAANNAQKNADSNAKEPGLGPVSSHGGAANSAAANSSSDRTLVDTKQLDERIKKAAEKAKKEGASAADKKEAAAAYLERGNVYYTAGQPRLYKYALADFRETLRHDPSNREAKDKIEQIEDIYRSMGRPIPNVNADQ